MQETAARPEPVNCKTALHFRCKKQRELENSGHNEARNQLQDSASAGFDIHGNRIRKYISWAPPTSMTQKQINKALQLQAVLFEEQLAAGVMQDSTIHLTDVTDIRRAQHA